MDTSQETEKILRDKQQSEEMKAAPENPVHFQWEMDEKKYNYYAARWTQIGKILKIVVALCIVDLVYLIFQELEQFSKGTFANNGEALLWGITFPVLDIILCVALWNGAVNRIFFRIRSYVRGSLRVHVTLDDTGFLVEHQCRKINVKKKRNFSEIRYICNCGDYWGIWFKRWMAVVIAKDSFTEGTEEAFLAYLARKQVPFRERRKKERKIWQEKEIEIPSEDKILFQWKMTAKEYADCLGKNRDKSSHTRILKAATILFLIGAVGLLWALQQQIPWAMFCLDFLIILCGALGQDTGKYFYLLATHRIGIEWVRITIEGSTLFFERKAARGFKKKSLDLGHMAELREYENCWQVTMLGQTGILFLGKNSFTRGTKEEFERYLDTNGFVSCGPRPAVCKCEMAEKEYARFSAKPRRVGRKNLKLFGIMLAGILTVDVIFAGLLQAVELDIAVQAVVLLLAGAWILSGSYQGLIAWCNNYRKDGKGVTVIFNDREILEIHRYSDGAKRNCWNIKAVRGVWDDGDCYEIDWTSAKLLSEKTAVGKQSFTEGTEEEFLAYLAEQGIPVYKGKRTAASQAAEEREDSKPDRQEASGAEQERPKEPENQEEKRAVSSVREPLFQCQMTEREYNYYKVHRFRNRLGNKILLFLAAVYTGYRILDWLYTFPVWFYSMRYLGVRTILFNGALLMVTVLLTAGILYGALLGVKSRLRGGKAIRVSVGGEGISQEHRLRGDTARRRWRMNEIQGIREYEDCLIIAFKNDFQKIVLGKACFTEGDAEALAAYLEEKGKTVLRQGKASR